MRFGRVSTLSTGSGHIAQKAHFGQCDLAKL